MYIDTSFEASLVIEAKWAFTTRRVKRQDVAKLIVDFSIATPGDLVLARVERIGSHKRVQLTTGRPSHLYHGDLVVLVCGARYAPDQYEGFAEINPDGADMLAGGGLVGKMNASNKRMSGPTRVIPLGLLANKQGVPLNIDGYALSEATRPFGLTIIAAIGASMNAGKTTAVASLAHGLGRAGYRVATLKPTGTGAFGDYNAYIDAGAHYVADMVDVGMASTYLQPVSRIVAGLDTLLCSAQKANCDVAIVELADGIFQKETAALLDRTDIKSLFDGYMFAAPCAASTVGGCNILRSKGIKPSIITGMISCSPLAAAEASSELSIEITTKQNLCDPALAGSMLSSILANREVDLQSESRPESSVAA